MYHDRGQYEKQLPWLKRAVAKKEAILGKEHPSSKRNRDELVVLLRDDLGQAEEAARLEAGGGVEVTEEDEQAE